MSEGYIRIGNNGKQEPAHRVVVERYLGRKLLPDESVHHIDEDRTNNKIENLIVFETNGHHIAYHKKKTWDTFYRPRVNKSMTVNDAKVYYRKAFGIVLYGPFYRRRDIEKRNEMIERTKREMGII